jgi:hypothetical protein
MARWMLAAGGLLVAVDVAARPTEHLAVERNGARVDISALAFERDDPEGRIVVSVAAGGRKARWTYRDLWLDPEEMDAPVADILPVGQRDYLLIRAYTGDDACCWTLLVFDLSRLRPLGRQLRSQSAIELVQDEPGCALAATATPVGPEGPSIEPPGPPVLYCFDGRRFSRKRR